MHRPSLPVSIRGLLTAGLAVLGLAAPASAAQFTQIAPGLDHTCAVKADGTAWCWGEGRKGQTGVIGAVRSRVPVEVIGSYQAFQIASGQAFWCQRLADSTASCSGSGERGQIGNGSVSTAQFPMEVAGISAVTKVAVGTATACAVNGTGVLCWGDGRRGQLGDGQLREGPQSTPVQIPNLTGVADVAVGDSHVCAVRNDGLVFCWGDTTDYKLGNDITAAITVPGQSVSGLTGAKAVAVGDRHSCALKTDGTVACWGEGKLGQLGIGTAGTTGLARLVPGLANITQIAASGSTTCAVRSDGAVLCWGDNAAGQIGNGTKVNALAPAQVKGITDAAQVGVGTSHACVVTKTQAPFCWGSNRFGQLGTGAPYNTTALTPQLVQDFVLGPATFLPASITGVPAKSTAGGYLQLNQLDITRRGVRCPKSASLRITARGKSSTRKVSIVKVRNTCTVSGRFILPKGSAKATKATYRITGSGLKTTTKTLKARKA